MPDEGDSGTVERRPGRTGRQLGDGVERTLVASLWLAVLINALASMIGHPFPVGHHIGSFLLVFDLFLIGSTALISAIGFYELFIGDIRIGGVAALPGWLAMHDLNELKNRVISMIVLVLAVTHAGEG